jgi:hypothetical protein
MATVTWTGGGNDGDWDNEVNWSTGTVPVDSDDVILDAGSRDIVDGLNQSAVTLTSLTIRPGYTGSIGANGTSLQISATTLSYSGGGEFININGTFTTAEFSPPGAGEWSLTGGTTTTLRVLGGQGYVAAATVVTNLDAAHALALNMEANATDMTTCTVRSGQVTTKRDIDDGDVRGGTLTLIEDANVDGTLEVASGGRVIKQSGGAIATIRLDPGARYSMAGATKPTAITTAHVYAGAQFQKSYGVIKTSVTTENNYGSGGNN